MSVEPQNNSASEQKVNDKEFNFRQLEAKFEKLLNEERASKAELQRELQQIRQERQQSHHAVDEDDDSEPYVDYKKLNKKLSSFEKQLEEKIEKKAEEKARTLLESEKRNAWLQSNSDFYEVMQYAEKLAEKNPDLAETILKMPDGFERQKLVYSNIKALGLHRPEVKQPSIQEKIDQNRKSPYYQPSGIGTAPYAPVGDFSPSGKENAFKKMKELQARLRI